MSRRIIQMFTGNGGDDCALADDGTTWWWESNGLDAGWHPLFDTLPQDTAAPSPDRAMLWAKVEERARELNIRGPSLRCTALVVMKLAEHAYAELSENDQMVSDLISIAAWCADALEQAGAGGSP